MPNRACQHVEPPGILRKKNEPKISTSIGNGADFFFHTNSSEWEMHESNRKVELDLTFC